MSHTILFACITWIYLQFVDSQRLPEYVTSECYGNSFNFECGQGHKIRINRDFFGHSTKDICSPSISDCVVANQKTDSLIHRYCTGKRKCPYFQVERRACNGVYTNYQQVEYQCVPDNRIVDICQNIDFETREVFISSTNFPQNYPPELDCSCFVSSSGEGALVHLEVVYMSILYSFPCRDWLRVGRTRMCGITVDLFSGQHIPLEFHSDHEQGHSGFWLQMQASQSDASLYIRCRNSTLRSMFSEQRSRSNTKPPTARNSFQPPTIPNLSQRQNQGTLSPVTRHQTNQPTNAASPVGINQVPTSHSTDVRKSAPTVSSKPVTNMKGNFPSFTSSERPQDRQQESNLPVDQESVNEKHTGNSDAFPDSFYNQHPTNPSNVDTYDNQDEQEITDYNTLYNDVSYASSTSPPHDEDRSPATSEYAERTADGAIDGAILYQNEYDLKANSKMDTQPAANLGNTEHDKTKLHSKQSTLPSTMKSNHGYTEPNTPEGDNYGINDENLLHTVHSFIPHTPDYDHVNIFENGNSNLHNVRKVKTPKDNMDVVKVAEGAAEKDENIMTTPPVTFNIQRFIQRKLNGTDNGIIRDRKKIKEISAKINFPSKDTEKNIGREKTKPPEILTQLNIHVNGRFHIPPVDRNINDAKITDDKASANSAALDGQSHLPSANSDTMPISPPNTLYERNHQSPLQINPHTRDNISKVETKINPLLYRKNESALQAGHVEAPHSSDPAPIDHTVDKGSATSIYKDINGVSTRELELNFNTNNYEQDLEEMDTSFQITHDDHLQRHNLGQRDPVGEGSDLDYFNTVTSGNYSSNSSIHLLDKVSNSSVKPINPVDSTEQLLPSKKDMINASLSPGKNHEWNMNEFTPTLEKEKKTSNYPKIVPTESSHNGLNNPLMNPKGSNYDKSDLRETIKPEDSTPSNFRQSVSVEEESLQNKTDAMGNNNYPQDTQISLRDNDPKNWEIISQSITPLTRTNIDTQAPQHNSYYYYYDHYFNVPGYTEPAESNLDDDDTTNPDLVNKESTFNLYNNKENYHSTNPEINPNGDGIFTKEEYQNSEESNSHVDKTEVTMAPLRDNSNDKFDEHQSGNPDVISHKTNEPTNNVTPQDPKQEMTSSILVEVQTSGDQVQSHATGGLWEITRGPDVLTESVLVDDTALSVTPVNEEAGTGDSPRDDLSNDKVVLLDGEEIDKTDLNVSDPVTSTDNTTDVLESSYEESNNIVTIGLIILSVCIGAGIILLTCFFIAILWHRRRRRITAAAQRPTLAIIHAQKEMLNSQPTDGDSGRSLLVHAQKGKDSAQIDSYAKGRGHQSVLDADSLYTKPKKKDKMLQIDIPDIYEDVTIHHHKTPKPQKKKKPSSLAPGVASYEANQNQATTHQPRLHQKHTMVNRQCEPSNQRDIFMISSSNYTFRNPMPIPTIKEEEFENDDEDNHQQEGHNKPNIPPKPKFLKNRKQNLDSDQAESFPSNGHNTTSSMASDIVTMKKKTIASMPGLAEMTFMPENSPVFYQVEEEFSEEDDSDWETRSAISL